MVTNCAPLLSDIFLYSYEAEFIRNLQKSGLKKQNKQCMSFNLKHRYTDDVLSLNTPLFSDYLTSVYPLELEI